MKVGPSYDDSGGRQASPPVDRSGPVGSITGGLFDRLQHCGTHAAVSDPRGRRTHAISFAGTIEQAAAGLSRRGMCPHDVIGVLAPVCPARLTAIYTVMASGGIALPLELTSDLDTLVDLLTETDTRLIVTTAPLARISRELADRSRVRQIISFGEEPETTPFGELLLPSPDGSNYDPARGLFDSGVFGYQAVDGRVFAAVHSHSDLLERFHRFDAELALDQSDTVAVEPAMSEADRTALAAVALWNGASVITTTAQTEPEIRQDFSAFRVTVRGAPVPARVRTRGY